ncbi:MAG: hypothetical protein R2771_14050 [Saprospiraceae bacterium]
MAKNNDIPFDISVNDCNIKVVGTKFFVDSYKDSTYCDPY